MSTGAEPNPYDGACPCRVKVIPAEKRIDILEIREDTKTGKLAYRPVLRFHKDCPHHGIIER